MFAAFLTIALGPVIVFFSFPMDRFWGQDQLLVIRESGKRRCDAIDY